MNLRSLLYSSQLSQFWWLYLYAPKFHREKCTRCEILLLNVVTAGIAALVVSVNIFSYACVNEVCRLWAQPRFDTIRQPLIIVGALWLQPVLQIGKQVVVTRSEIRAVRSVVKQLPVEMLQQWSSVSCCTWTCIIMEEHYTIYQHSTPFFLNDPMHFF
jgi:hypothetical protein